LDVAKESGIAVGVGVMVDVGLGIGVVVGIEVGTGVETGTEIVIAGAGKYVSWNDRLRCEFLAVAPIK
jgi:hypothetical protein